MNVLKTSKLDEILNFPKDSDLLAILYRNKPQGADIFFKKLMQNTLRIIGDVSKKSSREDIQYLLEGAIPKELKDDPLYQVWVSDMAEVCEIFCTTLGSDSVDFCLSTGRGCRRYHIDHVPMRLLVTYAGKGTEWIPDHAADRNAFFSGAPNEKIIKDPSKRQYMNTWDISIFRGGPEGLLHRTPDEALDDKSILLRLDHDLYWDKILKQQGNSLVELGINDIQPKL